LSASKHEADSAAIDLYTRERVRVGMYQAQVRDQSIVEVLEEEDAVVEGVKTELLGELDQI
jgi:hypothetical protein